jgi:hypothetical protein
MSKSGQDKTSTSPRKTVCDNNQAPKIRHFDQPSNQKKKDGKNAKSAAVPQQEHSVVNYLRVTDYPYPKQTKKVSTNGYVHNGTLPQDTTEDQKRFEQRQLEPKGCGGTRFLNGSVGYTTRNKNQVFM